MTCSEPGCEAKGERRCGQCQKPLCYGCWKFRTENFGGRCSACCAPPVRVLEEWEQRRRAPIDRWNAKQKALAAQTCPQGHALRGKNVVWRTTQGYRVRRCRLCKNLSNRAWRARKKAERDGGG